MAKLRLIFALIIISAGVQAQSDTTKFYESKDFGWKWQRMYPSKQLLLPKDTTFSKFGIAEKNGTVWHGNGSYWTALAGGGSGTTPTDLQSNRLISTGGISLVDTVVNVAPDIVWLYGGIQGLGSDTGKISITRAPIGYYRSDLIYIDSAGNFIKIEGTPDTTVGVPPALPDTGIAVTIVDVYGTTISSPVLASTYQRTGVVYISPTTGKLKSDSTQFYYNESASILHIGAAKPSGSTSSVLLNTGRAEIQGSVTGMKFNVGSGYSGGGLYDIGKGFTWQNRGNTYARLYSNNSVDHRFLLGANTNLYVSTLVNNSSEDSVLTVEYGTGKVKMKLASSGTTPNLDQVTTQGNTTANDVILNGSSLIWLDGIGNDAGAIRWNASSTPSGNHIVFSNNQYGSSFVLRPERVSGVKDYYLPDSSGTIALMEYLPSGGSNVGDSLVRAFDSLAAHNTRIGANTVAVAARAALSGAAFTGPVSITTTSGGLLIPRMTTTQRDAISSPATNLIVNNTTTTTIDQYSGSAWYSIAGDVTPFMKAVQAMGSPIKAGPLYHISQLSTGTSMVSTRSYFNAVYVEKPITITGAAFYQTTQGNFTGNNYNGIALYSYSGGTVTLIDSTARNENIWKGTSGTWQQAAFAGGSRTLQPGLYYLLFLYSSSAQTTAPVIGSSNSVTGTGNYLAPLTTNSARFYGGVITSVTSPPTSQACSAWTTITTYYGGFLY